MKSSLLGRSALCALACAASCGAWADSSAESGMNGAKDGAKAVVAQGGPSADRTRLGHDDGIEAAKLPTVEVVAPAQAPHPSVDRVEKEELDRTMARDMKSMTKFIPGVDADGLATGRGARGFVIRGLSGDRVATTIDGAPLPLGLEWGHNPMVYGRGLFESEMISGLDISKSGEPLNASSPGLGGGVNLRLYSPGDLLDPGQSFGAQASVSYDSANKERKATVAAAGAKGNAAALARVVASKSEEIDNFGDDDILGRKRTQPNPQKNKSMAALGKAQWGNGQSFAGLTLEHFRSDSETNLKTQQGPKSPYAQNDRKGLRTRASLRLSDSGRKAYDSLDFNAYWQTSEMKSDDKLARASKAPSGATAWSKSEDRLNQDQAGVSLAASWSFKKGQFLGKTDATAYHERLGAERKDTVYALAGGPDGPKTALPGFPIKYSPDSTAKIYGLSVGETLGWGEDLFVYVSPTLRFERRVLDSTEDEASLRARFSQWKPHYADNLFLPSARVGVKYKNKGEIWAGYSRTGRSPQFNAISSLSHVAVKPFDRMVFVPNPDLKNETGNLFELGAAYVSPRLTAKAEVYRHEYDNFISIWGKKLDTGNPAELALQTENLDKLSLSGVELSYRLALHRLATLRQSLSVASGKETQKDGKKTDYVGAPPAKLVTGLEIGNDVLSAAIDWTVQGDLSKKAPKADFTDTSRNTIDVTARWNPNKRFSLAAGVFNVFDQKYYDAADVILLNQAGFGRSVSEINTAPRRSFAAKATLSF